METLKIKQIDTTNYFDSEKLPKAYSVENCQYLGLAVNKAKDDKITNIDYHKFLTACKKVVESDVFKGILSIYEMDLTSFDVERKIYVNKDGTRAILTPDDKNDNFITNKDNIQHRAILVFAFKTELSKQELDNKFGNLFIKEGELPKKW